MVDRIRGIKNHIIDFVEEVEDYSHVNAGELGEFVDMIKDLAEAEKYCYEAWYYYAITEAMEVSDDDVVEHSSTLIKSGDSTMTKDEALETLRKEYRSLGTEERAAMKRRVLTTLGIR